MDYFVFLIFLALLYHFLFLPLTLLLIFNFYSYFTKDKLLNNAINIKRRYIKVYNKIELKNYPYAFNSLAGCFEFNMCKTSETY